MSELQIAGGGPAGAAAGIAALREGARVHIFERTRAARHKVCGEFISPEACALLEKLGVWSAFLQSRPVRIRRCSLHFGSVVKRWHLNEPGWGLSRFALDRLILEESARLGAKVTRGEAFPMTRAQAAGPVVAASGRRESAPRAARLFGFKAHFEGPADDAVELYFTRFGYVGISPVEDNLINVCGIAREDALRRCGFEIDEYLSAEPAVAERLRLLSRRMAWLRVGPLIFSRIGSAQPRAGIYPAGDALGFVDPFTGSGIQHALITGRLAGIAAARGDPSEEHHRVCRQLLDRPFAISGLFRAFITARLPQAAVLIPGDWLYRLTRAQLGGAADA